MLDTLEQHALRASERLPASAKYWSVRGVREYSEELSVRQGVAEAPQRAHENGAMVTVIDGGLGHATTSDLSEFGLESAFERAHALARASAGRTVIDFERIARPSASGRYASLVERPASSATLPEKLGWLRDVGCSETVAVMGTPYCGKGEPSQVIRVGHASPACRFSNVDVFGGAP
jgi:predicted Zn-dependent protease